MAEVFGRNLDDVQMAEGYFSGKLSVFPAIFRRCFVYSARSKMGRCAVPHQRFVRSVCSWCASLYFHQLVSIHKRKGGQSLA